MRGVLVALWAFLAYQASATMLLSRGGRTFLNLAARQGTNPGDCADICNSVDSIIEACGVSVSCICSNTVSSGVQACVDCTIDADPVPDVIATGLNLTDTFNNLCAGEDVTAVTLPALASTSSIPKTSSTRISTTPSLSSPSPPNLSTVSPTTPPPVVSAPPPATPDSPIQSQSTIRPTSTSPLPTTTSSAAFPLKAVCTKMVVFANLCAVVLFGLV